MLMWEARSPLQNKEPPTLIETLVTNGNIASAITSYRFGRLADEENRGFITIGHVLEYPPINYL